jgi:two-component system CheB/CheR fusion protein
VDGPSVRKVPARKRFSPSARSLRVLVADDNADSANGLAMLLEMASHQVRVAYDGQTTLTAAEEFRPHVVLLDVGMPDLDGYEVARRLRASPETKKVLLIAVTGWGQKEDEHRAKEAGFDHHLVKPFDPSAVEKLLADHQIELA